MNIPFYRYVEYLEDGHYLYQCLQCGEKIDVGEACFDPCFCWKCGVEYKGAILRKKEDWVYGKDNKREKLLFEIQKADIWSEDDLKSPQWRVCNGGYDRKDAIDHMKDLRKWQEIDKKEDEERRKKLVEKGAPSFSSSYYTIYRIKSYKMKMYRECFNIDTDAYFKRTGKKFNRKDYEKVA